MEVRTASIRDAREIAAVHIASWRATYRGSMPDSVLEALDIEQRARKWREELGDPDVDCMVVAPPIVGFCKVAASRDADCEPETGEITAIYLHPGHWRRGHGRALVAAALDRARRRGYRRLSLWVLRDNQRARSFYEAVGFSPDGCERTDTQMAGAPLHEVRYVRPVQGGPTRRSRRPSAP